MATRNTPAYWNKIDAQVRRATRHMTDSELKARTARQQIRCKHHGAIASWNVLQALYHEQHRRLHA